MHWQKCLVIYTTGPPKRLLNRGLEMPNHPPTQDSGQCGPSVRMERPTVGSTSANHCHLAQTFAQPRMLVVTTRVQPKDGWANGNGWAPLAGPLSNRSPNPTVGSELRERSATFYVGSTSTDHKK
ncbi:hypothetical protein PGT21_037228 [Puccinia graminis f. sp. tritici]|uniref:Uncharacterized protein n=1 Tax=Puccinia graminis f. sp. tritici TaxID=56615 RepID=A0A5B0R3D1_PUCGR|nr:hypothetical protein PGT21_037228 [Puccinia graminis f. sp. tritici]